MNNIKKIISIILLFIFSTSISLAYSPTNQDNNILNNFYKKADNLHKNSPEKLKNILIILEKNKNNKQNNQQINYLIKNSIKYINLKLNNNKIINRENAENKYKWDLTKIYKNTQEVEKEFEKLEEMIPQLASYKWQLNNEYKLLEFLKLKDEYIKYSDKIQAYIIFSQSINPNDNNIALLNEIDNNVYSKYSETIWFFDVEIKEFSDEKIDSLINNSNFSDYKNIFKDLKNNKKHILSQEAEDIINKFSNNILPFKNIYKKLINIDIKYPKITDPDGNEILTNYANIYSSRENNSQDFRKEFTEKLYNTYKQYENTLADIFIWDKREKTLYAKLRNYTSVLNKRYEWYNLPEEVYDNLVNTTRDNLDIFHKYVKLKKDYLWLNEIHYYDIIAPLEKAQDSYTYEQAKNIIISSLYKLWDKYIEYLKMALADNMVDVYSWENKDWWAFSGYSYLVKPHILFNFNNTLWNLKDLAHEAGHSVNFYNIINNQPVTYYYPSFPVEIPSITNEIILLRELANNTKTDKEKLAYLDKYMVTLSTNYWRATMYWDFERQIYDKLWNSEPVTLNTLNTIFEELFKKYYWPDFTYDDFLSIEWAIKDHFFRSYYTHEYAISIAAANTIWTNIYNEKPWFTEKYLDYLKTWTSELPNESLKKLWIDLTKKDYLEKNLKTQKEILSQMQNIINKINNK